MTWVMLHFYTHITLRTGVRRHSCFSNFSYEQPRAARCTQCTTLWLNLNNYTHTSLTTSLLDGWLNYDFQHGQGKRSNEPVLGSLTVILPHFARSGSLDALSIVVHCAWLNSQNCVFLCCSCSSPASSGWREVCIWIARQGSFMGLKVAHAHSKA